jgi:hypothetical protein
MLARIRGYVNPENPNRNVNIKAEVTSKTLDVVYGDFRASYKIVDGQPEENPFEIIKKDRIDDINIKSGYLPKTFFSDIRLSCNKENPISMSVAGKPRHNERLKSRSSFDFNWMRLDFTIT